MFSISPSRSLSSSTVTSSGISVFLRKTVSTLLSIWQLLTSHAHWVPAVVLARSSLDFLKISLIIMLPISRCMIKYKKSSISRRMKSMNQRNNNAKAANSVMHGLSLSGTVIDRTRRVVPHDNPTTEIGTYTIQDGYNHKFYVDDYAPAGYHDLDSNVCLPVYIKAYNRKNGDPSHTLNVQKMDPPHGEHF